MLNYEKIISEFDLSLVCSEEDKSYLMDEHDLDNIELRRMGGYRIIQ
ncbi:MAG: hypothetical protein IPM96_21565 [Ignavibacteria bacterium]|nr:hypothetical protein [Ignavibacteria bacterium]